MQSLRGQSQRQLTQGIKLVEQPGSQVFCLSMQKPEENGEHPTTAPVWP